MENPELRSFPGDFLKEIAEARPQLLAVILTIWRWGRQNPDQLKRGLPLGSFSQWSEWVRDPLIPLGCHDPVERVETTKANDADRLYTLGIFEAWEESFGDREKTCTEARANEKVKEAIEGGQQLTRQKFASRLSGLIGVRLGGYVMETPNKAEKERPGNKKKMRFVPYSYRLVPPQRREDDCAEPQAADPVEPVQTQAADADVFDNNDVTDVTDKKGAGPAGILLLITHAMKQQLRSLGFSEEQIANLTPQQALDILNEPEREQEPEQEPPSDPVERWRTCFARLDPRRDPYAGFGTDEGPRVHKDISGLLAGPSPKRAGDAGWTELELVGVHPEVGVATPNACGALMTNAYGSPVTQVTPQLIRFANGLAVYKARLSVGNSVAVWNHREPAANECATCRTGSPPWSEERNA